MSTLHEPRQQTARKPYACWWCGETINAGEHYWRWTWKDGRELLTCSVHPECYEVWCGELVEPTFAEFSRGCLCQRGFCRCVEHAAETREAGQ